MEPAFLRLSRRRCGLSQAALAARLRVSRETVNRWENGQSRPSRYHQDFLALILTPPAVPSPTETVDLKQVRRALGLSQEGLAAVLGVHRVTVLEWENGRKRPDANHRELLLQLQANVKVPVSCYLTLPQLGKIVGVHPKIMQIAAREGDLLAFKDTTRLGTWRATLESVWAWIYSSPPHW